MPTNEAEPRLPLDATQTFSQIAAQGDPLLGQVVGNYHVLARAGEGAFGVVYRARDVRLDRTVALKFLHGGGAQEAGQRFEQEARMMARLSRHEHVVNLYAWGEHEGRAYLVMEYLPESAGTLLARHPKGIPPETATGIIRQCTTALGAAHAQGIIHGDIKPSNILLGDDHQSACLADFGLAHLAGMEKPLAGSPAYMAPECLAGAPLSAASDIYALGATLYTLLAGEPPKGDALSATRKDLPPRLYRVVERAMAVDPALRYPNAEALLEDLDDRPFPTPQRRLHRARWVRRASMAAAVLTVALGAVMLDVPWGSSNAVVLADARLSLNHGDYETARKQFETYLVSHPDHAEARYGLAYAFLLEGDNERAAQEFAHLGEEAMREEGQAAVEYMASGEGARPALEHAAQEKPGGYAHVLLAMLDLMSGNFDNAQQELDQVKEGELPFDWQRRQYLQTLGQLRYKQGDFAEAHDIFARLESSGAQAPALAADYSALAQRRMEADERKDVGEQLSRLKTLMAETPPPAETEDDWTSRPMHLWIMPVGAGNGIIAQETGLVDVLPFKLSRALAESGAALMPVERGLQTEILAEQELSAVLGGSEDRLRLGRVLGARLLLDARVTRLMGEEVLNVSLVDTETTRLVPVGEYPITRNLEVNAWLRGIIEDVSKAVRREYPLRGVVRREGDEAVLNLGTEHGVRAGDSFRVVGGTATASVTGLVVADESTVTVAGAGMEDIPAEGWPVEQAYEGAQSHASR